MLLALYKGLHGETEFPWPFWNSKRRAWSINSIANGGKIKKRFATSFHKAKKPKLLWALTALVNLRILNYHLSSHLHAEFILNRERYFGWSCRWCFRCALVRPSCSRPYRHLWVLLEFEKKCGLWERKFAKKQIISMKLSKEYWLHLILFSQTEYQHNNSNRYAQRWPKNSVLPFVAVDPSSVQLSSGNAHSALPIVRTWGKWTWLRTTYPCP